MATKNRDGKRAEVVCSFLGRDPLSGSLFVFRNKGGHLVEIVWWDRGGRRISAVVGLMPGIFEHVIGIYWQVAPQPLHGDRGER